MHEIKDSNGIVQTRHKYLDIVFMSIAHFHIKTQSCAAGCARRSSAFRVKW